MKKILVCICIINLLTLSLFAQRRMESLGRGVVAIYKSTKTCYISWRYLASDPSSIGFNIYKSTGGAIPVKLNASVITATTDYIDANFDSLKTNSYFVKPVINGVEGNASRSYTLPANSSIKTYISLPLQPYNNTYSTVHVYVGDLDGDGEYDYVVKRFPKDSTLDVMLEAYNHDGAFMWKIDMGPNMEIGNNSATTPILVFDLDGDGFAEVYAKTGEGTVFADGTKIGDANSDGVTDYRTFPPTTVGGYILLKDNCPEYNSIIDGRTGKELARSNFLARGKKANWTSLWGDNYGHRMQFIFVGIAFLDGVHPSVVMSRGPGDKMDVAAISYANGAITTNWTWTSRNKTFPNGYGWTDFHAIRIVDVDNDGKDEISWGTSVLNNDGTFLYTNEMVHGDRFQIGDFDPDRPGLEAFAIQQNNPSLLGAALFDAATGVTYKKWYLTAVGDVGRGDVADVDPRYKGMENFSYTTNSLYDCKGNEIATVHPPVDLAIWWDGDVLREFIRGIGKTGNSPAIEKWNYNTSANERMFTMYNEGGSYSTVVPYAGRAPLYGDIMGDWREEVVCENSTGTELRIFTSTIPSQARIYCLMNNPAYRLCINVKGYLQSTYPDFYLGNGMSTPPTPNNTYVNLLPVVNITSPANNSTFQASSTISFTSSANDVDGSVTKVEYYNGNSLIGSSTTSPYTFNWANVVAGNYTITAKATDNNGGIKISSGINIKVTGVANIKPVVSLSASADNSEFILPAVVNLSAIATDADGTISKVELYNGSALIGTAIANGSTYSFAWNNVVAGTYSITAKATDNMGAETNSASITISVKQMQTIQLAKGWNLISINLTPNDSSIKTLFKNLDIMEIKTMDEYWRKDQNIIFNTLNYLETGKGYLVKMNSTGVLSINGMPIKIENTNYTSSNGWQLIGCPYQSIISFSTYLNKANCSNIKNFEGFWMPEGTTNSINNFEPGKGYFKR